MSEDKEILKLLGVNIRTLRLAKGYSQQQFAMYAEIDRAYIGTIERTGRNFSVLSLIKIARCLEVTVGDLFKGIT